MRTEASPATSLEASFGHADFLVLRLVDLLNPKRPDPVSLDPFRYQVVASAGSEDPSQSRPLLNGSDDPSSESMF